MTTYVLTALEATGIQDYIFGSNQLAQNIGASELVAQATRQWVCEAMPIPNNIRNADALSFKELLTEQTMDNAPLEAELIYAGGGNALLLFKSKSIAQTFTRRLTQKVLCNAPGLSLVVAHHENFDWQTESLADVHSSLRKVLTKKKVDRHFSTPLLGLGITATDSFTGHPAVELIKEKEVLVSAEVQAKLNASEIANQRLRSLFSDVYDAGYEFTYDFNLFGTPGESSYIAVIHADGNDMGRRVQDIACKFCEPAENRAYIKAVQAFSQSMEKVALSALQNSLRLLIANVDLHHKKIGEKVSVPFKDEKLYLPFRPIVFGGDDVTFVSEGRLGLALAVYYLRQIVGQNLSDGKPAHSRAGVAIVKTHYPFARAYRLAEALLGTAKKQIVAWQEGAYYDGDGITAIDWHFATTGPVLDLSQIREREFVASDKASLLMRPVWVAGNVECWRSWDTFTDLVTKFQEGVWAGKRNKVKVLRDVLRQGCDGVKSFRGLYHLPELPDVSDLSSMKKCGWQGGRCGYFDAIEALDFFVSLDKGKV